VHSKCCSILSPAQDIGSEHLAFVLLTDCLILVAILLETSKILEVGLACSLPLPVLVAFDSQHPKLSPFFIAGFAYIAGYSFPTEVPFCTCSYQMNPGNYREALIEVNADESEGADILMVSHSLLQRCGRAWKLSYTMCCSTPSSVCMFHRTTTLRHFLLLDLFKVSQLLRGACRCLTTFGR
jgi:hypothetical protein